MANPTDDELKAAPRSDKRALKVPDMIYEVTEVRHPEDGREGQTKTYLVRGPANEIEWPG